MAETILIEPGKRGLTNTLRKGASLQNMSLQIPTYKISNITRSEDPYQLFYMTRFEEFLENRPSLVCPHKHDFYHIIYFTNGTGVHTIDFIKYQIRKDVIFLLRPGQVHTWEFSEDVTGFAVLFSKDYYSINDKNPNPLKEFPFFDSFKNPPYIHMNQQGYLQSDFERLLTEFESNNSFKDDLIRAIMKTILIQLARIYQPFYEFKKGSSHLIRDYENLLDEYYRSRKTPHEYASLLNVTANHLNAACKKFYGITAGKIIRERIILEAKRMLVHSDQSILQIGHYLNFEDNSYFSRFFKKYVGQSPEGFRKNQ